MLKRPRSRAAMVAIAAVSAAALGAVPGAHVARAAGATVTNCNDSGPGSLRAAVLSGAATITFATVCRAGNPIVLLTPITLAADVSINGGAAQLAVISASAAPNGFIVNPGVTASLSNLTIENTGTGVVNKGTLTVNAATFLNDVGGTLVNPALMFVAGGGIASTGVLTVLNSTFTGDAAPNGGAIGAALGSLTVRSSTFSGNQATTGGQGGGAIFSAAQTSIGASTFTANVARQSGGAITLETLQPNGAGATVSGSVFRGNRSAEGGSLALFSFGPTLLSGDTFGANAQASVFGGAILNGGTDLTIAGSSITGSTAGQGGGIYNVDTATLQGPTTAGNLTLTGTVVTGNRAVTFSPVLPAAGGGIFNASGHGGTVTLDGSDAVVNNTPNNCTLAVGTCT